MVAKGFPGGSDCKESAYSAGAQVSIQVSRPGLDILEKGIITHSSVFA